ncbi:ABC transporter ATP-binding protein [Cohnella sp.]|uniref:ABC transporter ATP-binding protein n=1 Tax=Cohnella sp. TaxID=1883426 RepID=UPI0035672472
MDIQLIEAKQLTVRYPFQQRAAIKEIDLRIGQGERVLILGPSGGGKSTLALAITGIIPRSVEAELSGEMTVDGISSQEMRPGMMSRKVGILFQDTETQFCMTTVEDEIAFGLENIGLTAAEMDIRIGQSLKLTGLDGRRYAGQQELSGGLKQKLGLACLLAMDQDTLILDEPTANLDPETTDEMFALLSQLAEQSGKTLIFIEHKLDDLIDYIDRVIVLGDEGSVIADGSPRQIFYRQIDMLQQQGIWVPRLCIAAKQLESFGIVWETLPLTLAEWDAGLLKQGLTIPKLQQDGQQSASDEERCSEPAITSQAEPEPPLLELQNVSYAYGSRDVLHNLSCTIPHGDFVALLGPNGTGKSTLVQLLVKLLTPKQGRILLHGTSLDKLSSRQLMQKVGLVFQNPEHQFIRDTVIEELSYGLQLSGHSKESIQSRLDDLLQRFRLTEQRNHNPFSLSQGQKRRLSVATMLTSEQELLILDEPTFGQDYVNTVALMDLLRDLNQEGTTVLMITHDMELVKQYASRVLLLNEGHLIYDGKPTALFSNDHLMRQAAIKRPLTDVLEQRTRAFMEAKQCAGSMAEA